MRVDQSTSKPVQGSETTATKKTEKAAHAKKGQAPEAKANVSTEGANAEISPRGKEMAQAKAVASDAPDVREEKIAALKARIASGKYHVDADAIADRMVDDHLKSGIG